jgi:hypothetical protein
VRSCKMPVDASLADSRHAMVGVKNASISCNGDGVGAAGNSPDRTRSRGSAGFFFWDGGRHPPSGKNPGHGRTSRIHATDRTGFQQ